MKLSNSISVDCVVLGYDAKRLNVLLVRRATEMEDSTDFKSDWSLTGNHIYENEKIDDAAKRILFDLTGFTDVYLEQFKTFADPDRLSGPLQLNKHYAQQCHC